MEGGWGYSGQWRLGLQWSVEVGVTVVSGGWGYSGPCVVYPGDFRTMFQPHNVWAFLLGLKYSTEVGGVGGQGMACVRKSFVDHDDDTTQHMHVT